jgi:hypothetical protein
MPRAEWPRDQRPKGILGSCDMALRNDTCSAMGASEEDFQFVVEDVLEEYQEAQPEFAEMQAPCQQKGRLLFFLNQNSREPVTEPDEMVPLWKILHLVGADWTYGTKGWAAENYCMFSVIMKPGSTSSRSRSKRWRIWAARSGSTPSEGTNSSQSGSDCKNSSIDYNFEIKSIIQLYAQWIKEGKLKPSSDWNKDRKIKFTVQDPCQLVRKSFGDPVAEDLRYVVKAVVGEENFIDMYPNRSNNFCCGGGGGFLQSGYPDESGPTANSRPTRSWPPRQQYAITPCHNCHAQVHDLSEQRSPLADRPPVDPALPLPRHPRSQRARIPG